MLCSPTTCRKRPKLHLSNESWTTWTELFHDLRQKKAIYLRTDHKVVFWHVYTVEVQHATPYWFIAFKLFQQLVEELDWHTSPLCREQNLTTSGWKKGILKLAVRESFWKNFRRNGQCCFFFLFGLRAPINEVITSMLRKVDSMWHFPKVTTYKFR